MRANIRLVQEIALARYRVVIDASPHAESRRSRLCTWALLFCIVAGSPHGLPARNSSMVWGPE
jgi:hypothetical protein